MVMAAVTEEQNKEAGSQASRRTPIVWNPKPNATSIKLPYHKLEQSFKRQEGSLHKPIALEQKNFHRTEKQKKQEENRVENTRLRREIGRLAEEVRQKQEREEQEKKEPKTAKKKTTVSKGWEK